MIKLTLYNGTTIFVNPNHVVNVSEDPDTTFIQLTTGGIHVKEKVNRVVDALTEQPQDLQTKAEFEHYDRTKPVEETTVEELKATIEEWKRQGRMK